MLFTSGTIVEWRESITNVTGHKALVRGLRLRNRLNVLLWSDAKMHKAGAAVAFDAGSWSDPPNHPGVAHFLEHMVFLGSARFPEQDVLFAYLAQHGGNGNAYTASETTNYFFEVDPPFLTHATSILADSVIAPLLSEGSAVAEMNAVNAEHAKNRARDGWRLDMLSRCFALPQHELSRFGTGNEETLRSSLPELRAFHAKHYTASHAAVALAGPLSLDDLEAVAVAAFSNMPQHFDPSESDEDEDRKSVSSATRNHLRLQPYLFASPEHPSGRTVILTPNRP
jgi:insulysin